MKRLRRLAPTLMAAFALLVPTSVASGQAAKPVQPILVSDAVQLINAIASDRTIVLKKGDYKLSSAYGLKTKNASWIDADDGKELQLSNLRNVTIRGADGARILSESRLASILGLYDSSNVTLDDIAFVRQTKAGAEAGAGSLYAESVQGLTVDRCSFEGPTTTAIELWECKDASIARTDISGTSSGALSASYTQGLRMNSTKISACEGYPLLYLENSDDLLFKATAFEGNKGGNFIEVYSDEGGPGSIRFDGCSFKGNQVDYFSGTDLLPSTIGCAFVDNSFDQNWASDSVASSSDEEYYYGGGDGGASTDEGQAPDESDGLAQYDHPSGLSFSYPQGWNLEDYPQQARVGVFAPDGKSLVFFLQAYAIPANDAIPAGDPSGKKARKVMADAYAALAGLLKAQTGVVLSLKAAGDPGTGADNGLVHEDFAGAATKGDGERAEARARFIVKDGKVEAMVGLAADASSLAADGDIDAIFASVEVAQTGGQ